MDESKGHLCSGGVRWIDALAIGYVLFIVYASLIPFGAASAASNDGARLIFGLPANETNFPDLMSNLAVYFPMGLLLRGFFANRQKRPLRALVLAVGAAGAISYCVESVQMLMVSRVASFADFVCNVVGAAVGALVFTPERTLPRRTTEMLHSDAAGVQAGMWGTFTCLATLAPFDLTFDVSLVVQSVREAYFLPFVKHAELAAEAHAPALMATSSSNEAVIELWDLRLDYLAGAFMFAILGALATRLFRARGHGRMGSVLAGWVTTSAVGILTTAAGLFVMSVGLDATHAVTRSAGGLCGALGYIIICARPMNGANRDGVKRQRDLITAGIVVCLLYITARQLCPFNFAYDSARMDPARVEWLPLHAYSLARFPQAAMDLVHKSFRFAAIGTLLALHLLTSGGRLTWKRRTAAAGALAVSAAVLEAAQLLLPGRVPAVTDVLIAWFATIGGIFAGEFFWEYLNRRDAALQAVDDQSVLLNIEIPPVSADAPKERVPEPTPQSPGVSR